MDREIYELTNSQKSIWFTEEFYKGTAINNICGNLIIKEKVDFNKLVETINLFVKTNDSFRLKFFVDESVPKQYVSDFEKFNVEIIDVIAEEDILKLQKEMVNIPFVVTESLLFKFKIVRLPNGTGSIITCIHHLISDAATFAILAKELIKIYSSLVNSKEVHYNTNSYIDYIKSEQEYLQSEKFNKDKKYWNDLYKDVPEVATIPSLSKGYDSKSLDALREEIIIPNSLMKKINLFCRQNKVTAFNLFMALYALYLSRVSNLDELVIGTPILNRTNFIEKNTSGMFINTAAFKVSINHLQPFKEFISKISIDSLSMLRHQKYPYQQLIEHLRKNGSNIPTLYDFAFSYQVTKATDKKCDIAYTTHWLGNNKISNSIEVHAHDNDDNGTLTIAYDYKTSKYSKEDITNIHNRICCMLNQIIEEPEIKLNEIQIATPEEKQKILYEFNDTKVDYPKDKTISQLFEEQVEKNPDNIAVVFEGKKLTYKELNEKANSLARYLKEQGVQTQDKVLILADKSIDMYVSIMAILKLGALYVPVDNEYPEERIKIIIQDCKPKIVIVDEKYEDLVKGEKLCKIPLQNLERYESTNFKNNITSRRRSIYNIYFWINRKSERCNCTS